MLSAEGAVGVFLIKMLIIRGRRIQAKSAQVRAWRSRMSPRRHSGSGKRAQTAQYLPDSRGPHFSLKYRAKTLSRSSQRDNGCAS